MFVFTAVSEATYFATAVTVSRMNDEAVVSSSGTGLADPIPMVETPTRSRSTGLRLTQRPRVNIRTNAHPDDAFHHPTRVANFATSKSK